MMHGQKNIKFGAMSVGLITKHNFPECLSTLSRFWHWRKKIKGCRP